MALNVSAIENTLATQAADDTRTALTAGAKVDGAGADVISQVMTEEQYDTEGAPTVDYAKSVAVGLVRQLTRVVFPLPTYRCNPFNPGTDPPAASSYTGALIYVTDGAAGQPIVAFSDGTDWLRVDTRGVINYV